MAHLIEIRDLLNQFGEQIVHDHLEINLEYEEILGLVGGSGSGKSVLLRSILGLNKSKAGEILIEGENIQSLSEKKMFELRRNWGVLFQNGALFSGLTVLDNVALPMREHTDLNKEEINERAFEKLKMAGLDEAAAQKYPFQLSGGMAKRAALARALALDPKILFLDEPTAGLDPIAAAAFDQLILKLRDDLKLSVLIITHDLDTLVTVCDRIAMIVDKKIQTGTLQQMMKSNHPWIKEYFGGPRMHAIAATTQTREIMN